MNHNQHNPGVDEEEVTRTKPKKAKLIPLSYIMAKSAERVKLNPRLPQGHCDYCGLNYEAELVRPVQANAFTQKMACKMCSQAYRLPWLR
jgi:hypothetical protein